ncbi:hypothetical protein [Burkholderia pseudomallei]|uniref:hypothetical protein n=1 Tax=Burkholderia pseudomallei TaxID=28450 RepID=UPI000DD0890B
MASRQRVHRNMPPRLSEFAEPAQSHSHDRATRRTAVRVAAGQSALREARRRSSTIELRCPTANERCYSSKSKFGGRLTTKADRHSVDHVSGASRSESTIRRAQGRLDHRASRTKRCAAHRLAAAASDGRRPN